MSTCVLQGGWEAMLCWDAAVKAKENSSFEEAISLEFHRSWCYCSKCLIYVLHGFKYESSALCCSEGEGSETSNSFNWGIFQCSLMILKGHGISCLLRHWILLMWRKQSFPFFLFLFSLIVWNYMAEGYTLNTFNVCFKTTGQVYRNYVWRKI